MLSKVEVLFFAADPFAASPDGLTPPLKLGRDVQEISEQVDAARYPGALRFSWRLAARPRDLMGALREKRPQIVHFSGHGDSAGLMLLGTDGAQPRHVDTAVLRQLFATFPGDIRLVVLSACFSQEQAAAIAQVVGCAIGTRGEIPDDAAIAFNAAFYRAIASGCSVKAAYEQARTALALEQPEFGECTELMVRPDADPAKLVLVSRLAAVTRLAAVAATIFAFALTLPAHEPPEAPAWRGVRLGDCTSVEPTSPAGAKPVAPAEASSKPSGATGAAADLEEAKALCRAGDYAAAFPLFKSAADAKIPEAMGFLGIAYQSGEGTERHPALAAVFLRDAAYAGDPRGMIAWGVAFLGGEELGYEVTQSNRWARYWFEKAANELGSVEAMLNLGRLSLEERKDSLALAWFQRAVEAGSVDATIEIGLMREHGRAGRRNPAEALRLYRLAAGRGSARGMFEVGKLYQNGVGVRRSYDSAAVWYLNGACAGSADAMYHLGLLYERGLGVDADRDEAIRWLRRAEDADSPVAARKLAQLGADRPSVPRALARLARPGPRTPPGCERPHALGGARSIGAEDKLAAL